MQQVIKWQGFFLFYRSKNILKFFLTSDFLHNSKFHRKKLQKILHYHELSL